MSEEEEFEMFELDDDMGSAMPNGKVTVVGAEKEWEDDIWDQEEFDDAFQDQLRAFLQKRDASSAPPVSNS